MSIKLIKYMLLESILLEKLYEEKGKISGKNILGKMASMKFFVDTQILVHYLILSNISTPKKEDEATNEKKDLWKRYGRLKSSYEFIQKSKANDSSEIVTCSLAFSEIPYALLDEVLCIQMWIDGVPCSSWGKVRDKFQKQLSDDDIKDIHRDIEKLKDMSSLQVSPW